MFLQFIDETKRLRFINLDKVKEIEVDVFNEERHCYTMTIYYDGEIKWSARYDVSFSELVKISESIFESARVAQG